MKDVDIMIFGASRCGKTTCARMLAERFGYPMIHMDALYNSLQEVYSFNGPGTFEMDGRSLFIHRYLRNSKYEDRFSRRYILEGNVAPLDALYFFHPERNIIYFLGMTELSSQELFEAIRKNDDDGEWTAQQPDEEVLNHASRVISRSKRYKELCEKHHIPYVETSGDRTAILSSVMDEISEKLRQIDSEP